MQQNNSESFEEKLRLAELPEIEPPKKKFTKKDLFVIIAIIGVIGLIILGVQGYKNELQGYYLQGQVDLYGNIFGISQCSIIPNVTMQINSTTSVPINLVNCLK